MRQRYQDLIDKLRADCRARSQSLYQNHARENERLLMAALVQPSADSRNRLQRAMDTQNDELKALTKQEIQVVTTLFRKSDQDQNRVRVEKVSPPLCIVGAFFWRV